MGFSVATGGSFRKTESFLQKIVNKSILPSLESYGREGVSALAAATPRDTAYTASCWEYEIQRDKDSYSIIWGNSNVVDGQPIAVLIQIGHATRNGGFVQGVDYINPALKPIFDRIAADAWKAVTTA